MSGLFQAFNEAKTFETGTFFARHDVVLATGPREEACIQCGKCMSACPQKIDIPKYMRFFKSIVTNRSRAIQHSISENFDQYVLEHETLSQNLSGYADGVKHEADLGSKKELS